MLQAFIIVAREGLESFLIVAIIMAYLKKTGRPQLVPVAYAGIVAAVLASIGTGLLFADIANQSLWEGILAVVATVMVGSLVIHMWKIGPKMKSQMELRLAAISQKPASKSAIVGIFLFSFLLLAREGMETALMLFQVKNQPFIIGGLLGLAAAAGIAVLWTKFSHLVNLKRFFQVTGAFLLVFMVQTLVYAFHELCEAGVFAQSDRWHELTEPYSPDGMYGKWFSFITVLIMGGWLVTAAVIDYNKRKKTKSKGSHHKVFVPGPVHAMAVSSGRDSSHRSAETPSLN